MSPGGCACIHAFVLFTCLAITSAHSFAIPPNYPGLDPISERDCDDIASILALSAAQRYAMERAYDRYLERYTSALEGIERPSREFDTDTLQGVIDFSKAKRAYFDRLRALQRAEDAAFFAQVESGLAEEQAPAFAHVLSRRTLETMTCARFLQQTGRPWVDLFAFARDMGLEDPRVLDVLRAYDSACAPLIRRLNPAEVEVQAGLLDEYRNGDFGDDFAAMGEARPRMWGQFGTPFLRYARELDRRTRTAVREVEELLGPEERLEWRLCYQIAVYDEIDQLFDREWRTRGGAAALADKSPAIAAQADELADVLATGLREVIARYDVWLERKSPFARTDPEHWKHYESMDRARSEVTTAWIEAYGEFEAGLGEDRAAWDTARRAVASPGTPRRTARDGAPRPGLTSPLRGTRPLGPLLLLLDELAVDADLVEWARGADRQLANELREFDGSDSVRYSDAQLAHVTTRLASAGDRLRAAAPFDEEPAGVLLEQALGAARRAATDVRHGSSGLAALDLVTLVHVRAVDRASEHAAGLAAYARAAGPLIAARRAAMLAGEGGRMIEPNRELAQVTWAQLQPILEACDADRRRVFMTLIRQLAFPELFVDRDDPSPVFRAALQLSDLDEAQATEIAIIRNEHTAGDAALLERMIEAVKYTVWWWQDENGTLWPGGANEPKDALRSLRLELEQLRGHTRRRVLETLTDEQRAGIVGE